MVSTIVASQQTSSRHLFLGSMTDPWSTVAHSLLLQLCHRADQHLRKCDTKTRKSVENKKKIHLLIILKLQAAC